MLDMEAFCRIFWRRLFVCRRWAEVWGRFGVIFGRVFFGVEAFRRSFCRGFSHGGVGCYGSVVWQHVVTFGQVFFVN